MLDVVGLDDRREVGALRDQCGQQLVDVAADAAAVRRDGGRVDEHARLVRQEELPGSGGTDGSTRDYEGRRSAPRRYAAPDARNHPGRRQRHPAVPDHQGHQQAADADLRQADDLLPALPADECRDPRGPDHHHARGPGRLPAAARRRLRRRHRDQLRRPAAAGGPRPGVHHRRGLHRRRVGRAGARRQHLLRHRPRREPARQHRTRPAGTSSPTTSPTPASTASWSSTTTAG